MCDGSADMGQIGAKNRLLPSDENVAVVWLIWDTCWSTVPAL